MKDNPHLMTDLMTASSSHKLTPQALKKLYCITFSDVGSRKRRDEEDTVYFFEMYLQECEGKQRKQLSLWQTVIVYRNCYSVHYLEPCLQQ